MLWVALVAAALAGLLHVYIFTMESLTFLRPATYRRFAIKTDADAQTIRPWALNQGFYNLFLGLGALVGVGLLAGGYHVEGRTLVAFACGCMLGAACVLALTDKRMLRAAVMQGLFPLLALATLAAATARAAA